MRKKDILLSLVVGEISAWLIIVLAGSLLSTDVYDKYSKILMLGLPVVFPVACLAGLFVAYLISKKIAIVFQIAKFVLVGGFNTLVDWGVLALTSLIAARSFDTLATDPMLAVLGGTLTFYTLFKAISFTIAATNSYPWNKYWTFTRKTEEKTAKEFLQFFIITLIGFIINVSIATLVFEKITPIGSLTHGQWEIIAAAIATVISMTWNFLGYKFIVFDSKKNAPQAPNQFPSSQQIQSSANKPAVTPPRRIV